MGKIRLLYGTGNQAKLDGMRKWLEPLEIEIIGLGDLKKTIPAVQENGMTPLENARLKASAYYEAFHMPVFSCDSGLYFDNVPSTVSPGIHVRTIGGKYLSDEEMIAYYSGLAKQYGNLTARYKNAICLIMDYGHRYEAMEPSMESKPFLIADKPHPDRVRKAGFPLDCLSVDIGTGKYYYDLPEDTLEQVATKNGFLEFFVKNVEKQTFPV